MTKLEALADEAIAAAHRMTDAAPGIASSDAEPVNAAVHRSLYAARKKVYPRLTHGTFRSVKWVVMAVTLGIYYLLPWLRWLRAEGLPDQAVLIDFEHQRVFLGPLEIWPQEFYIVTGLLVISALGLFLVTAVAGRVWCGYACPQTVWTDLMVLVERFWQGDRNARIRLDAEGWSLRKIALKTGTHLTWLLIGLLTGGALVFYFRDAPTLARELLAGTAPSIAYAFLGIFTLATYLLGGIAREQVCTYMCPWPRIQGALFDRDSLLVSYRTRRGEPRGPLRKSQGWEGRGDCIDCKACVAVCPMGIDIRDGPQLECIQCALCIDACNAIMDKVDRPRGLIGYDTFRNLDALEHGTRARLRLVRPRTLLYGGLILMIGTILLWAVAARPVLQIDVLRDRNPLFVLLSDGSIRNGYTVKILNKRPEQRSFQLSVERLPGARVQIQGFESDRAAIPVDTDTLRELRLFISQPPASAGPAQGEVTPFAILVTDTGDGSTSRRETTFRRPQ